MLAGRHVAGRHVGLWLADSPVGLVGGQPWLFVWLAASPIGLVGVLLYLFVWLADSLKCIG